jgi:peptidoglycan/xylan/chitin deacetylase (PgdA/CDA1 family)
MLDYKKINILFFTLLTLLLILSCYITVKWWYFLVLLGIRFLVLFIGSSLIQSNFHITAYCNNPNEKEKKIALTFDDGPSPITLQILRILEQHNAKATFFCIGKHIEKYPEILQQTVQGGHLVGNHSYSHSHFFDFYRKDKLVLDLQKADKIIREVIGKRPIFFRPPYGVTNPAIRKALAITNHYVIGWSIRSMDGIIKNEKIIFNRIVKRISPGSIVLLHDTSQNTVKVLEQLLVFLKSNKYQIVSLEELLEIKAYEK